MNIKDSIAWVSGGASGIGEDTVMKLIEGGARVMITDVQVDKGQALAEKMGKNCFFVKADVTNPEDSQTAGKALINKWGKIDILVNCAGKSETFGFMTDDPEEYAEGQAMYERDVKLNLLSSFYISRVAANAMRKNEPNEFGERGCIILIASMAADKVWFYFDERGQKMPMGYGSGKAGMLGLNRDLAVVCAPFGIRCNVVQPGFIKTPLTDKPRSKEIWPPMQLFPKDGGQADNIGSMCIEVIKNSFVNRANIRVDAGIVG
jgi:3-hydroxyacyl-CoA dehydrogenase/3-hydroxy-2-methylbutyryl-CoA dehydrogenase